MTTMTAKGNGGLTAGARAAYLSGAFRGEV
jgi:hypothetical protein